MRPTLRCLFVFVAAIPVALLPALLSARLVGLWLAWTGLAILAAGVDALLGPGRGRLRIDVAVPDTLFIGDSDPLVVTVRAPRLRRAVAVEIVLDLEPTLEGQPARTVTVPPGGEGRLEVPLFARRRGPTGVRALWARWQGPLGLMSRQTRVPLDRPIGVVPNVRAVRAAALRFFGANELRSGLKVERFVGDGSEFESLREYVPGLDHRAIDWKASARHRKLLCQQFRAERNHQVILALDVGHLMGEPLGRVPRLDHAINAGLLLGYTCLRAGDRVGIFGFDEKVRVWAEPQGGLPSFPRLRAVTAELDYGTGETNFTLGLAELSSRLRRRSLVVLLTDFVDTVTAELMIDNLDRLARRHLVLIVAMRDPALEELAWSAPRSLSDLYRSVASGDLVRERDVVLRRLRRLGIQCVDAPPHAIAAPLLNRYLDIKRRELV